MDITELLQDLKDNKVVVKLVDNQLEVSLFGETVDPELLATLKNHKEEVISYLSSFSFQNSFEKISRLPEAVSYQLSNAQLRIWLESQSDDASKAYHMPFELDLKGDYDLEKLEQAIRFVINRHEILRTVFRLDENREVRQYIIQDIADSFKINYQDFQKEKNKQQAIRDYLKSQLNASFDLENGPLLKISLIRYTPRNYVFFCNMHHIICDAWSIPILKNEILLAYTSLCDGNPPAFPDLEIQYKDYAAWNNNNLKSKTYTLAKSYWLNQFDDEVPVLEFPLKGTRPPLKTYNGQTLKTYIGRDLTKKILAIQQEREVSLFMFMLGLFHVMLSKYTGAEDIVIGSPFAAREHASLTNQIGFYTNTLALRNQLKATDSFETFLSSVKQNVLKAHKHQQYPLDELVKDLNIKKDTSRNPLFDAMLVVLPDNSNFNGVVDEEHIDQIAILENETSKFDLLLFVEKEGDFLSLKLEYNSDLFEEELIRQFLQHFQKVLELLIENPQKNIGSINYLSESALKNDEIDLEKYNSQTVIALFEKQVEKTPDAIAVCYEDIQYTYQQLNDRVNQFAHYLRSQKKHSVNNKIGVLLGRSHWNVIAMLGVIKSGACYVPIDAEYHENRQKYIIEDSDISIVVSLKSVWKLDSLGTAEVIHLDTFAFREWYSRNPRIQNTLNDEAFVIYTSGSTGNPKGVIQTHSMLSNLIQWNILDAGICTGLKYLQYTSFSFDVSLQDCWFVLSSGGTLYITPEQMKIDFVELSKYILAQSIEVLCFPFSALSNFVEFIDEEFLNKHNVKHVISSGEQLLVNNAMEKFLTESPEVKLHNHYGPSETHVVTSYTCSVQEGGLTKYVPIGKALPNTNIYLLDKSMQPVPKFVVGELYVGGANVATGYLNLPHLTNQRFVKNPFAPKERLYKTGDLACLNKEEQLIYLGRNDNQVKIRGYRIELAEIKNTILALDGIKQAHVDVVEKGNEKNIVAYVASSEEVNKLALKDKLKTLLPEYMVPAYILIVDELPLTSNGKINKSALPQVNDDALIKAAYLTPQTKTEKELVQIWENVLEVDRIGILDNFFELGGHSLLITRMLYDINEKFGIKLQMKNIFSAQSIKKLADVIDEEIIFKNGITVESSTKMTGHQPKSEVWEI